MAPSDRPAPDLCHQDHCLGSTNQYLHERSGLEAVSLSKMPQLRDITVRVTDSKGVELEEWAVQNLRNQHKISAYIKAKSDMPFRVSVQAKIPYTDYELPHESAMESDTCLGTHDPDRIYNHHQTGGRFHRNIQRHTKESVNAD